MVRAIIRWTIFSLLLPLAAAATPFGGAAYRATAATTGEDVLISQLNSGRVFATSSTPAGDFTVASTQSSIGNVTTGMSGDQSVFSDSSGRTHLCVGPLRTSDFLHVETAVNVDNSSSGGRAGDIMFKHGGTYYFCSSDLHGRNASHTYGITSAKIAGDGIGYDEWAPVSFGGRMAVFHSLSQWTVDAAAGTWATGAGNNYVLNPNVVADRVSQSTLAGWTWVNVDDFAVARAGQVVGVNRGRA